MTDPLVDVRALTKRFPLAERGRFVQAAHDVTFSIAPGETLGLVGESGSGKTTVGRLLVRLLDPTEGEIVFQGERIDELSHREFRSRRSDIQIVFQEPAEALNPRMSVRHLIAEPLRLHGVRSSAARAGRVDELLEQVGLGRGVADERPSGLSAGNQQRVAIARALATSPRFLVLDEPTSSLPADATEGVLQLLSDLQGELKLSYLFISHDLTLVRHFCNRVAVMYLGQIVEIGSRSEVFDDPMHPYSRALLESVLQPDPSRRRVDAPPRVSLEGEIPSPVDLPPGCYLAGRCPAAVDRCHREEQRLVSLSDRQSVRCWRISERDLSWDDFDTAGYDP
jgi:oligopeptide/dipeptide ABC transporter ATP-binding protein